MVMYNIFTNCYSVAARLKTVERCSTWLASYKIVYTKRATKDIPKLKAAGLDDKAKALIQLLRKDPYQFPPTFEKLQGDLYGAFSRRINIQHRLVYQVLDEEKIVKIISLRSHYE